MIDIAERERRAKLGLRELDQDLQDLTDLLATAYVPSEVDRLLVLRTLVGCGRILSTLALDSKDTFDPELIKQGVMRLVRYARIVQGIMVPRGETVH